MKNEKLGWINRLAATGLALAFAFAAGGQSGAGKMSEKKKEMKSPMIKHEYADVNGVRLHYATAGKGKLIMFVHGFPEFWYEWKNQLAEFGKDHMAVAPDMRGYNLSSKPAEVDQYQVKYLIEDVGALAAKLGHKKFILG